MKLLLDTHVLLWWLAGDQRLAPDAKAAVRDGANEVLVSAASVWEIEVKRTKGSLVAPENLIQLIEQADFGCLAIDQAHATAAGRLPRHHDDPFDRVLVAQASIENAVLVTSDPMLAKYGVALYGAG